MKELKSIFLEGTTKGPQIDFNHLTGELILYGKSIPENAAKIYEPLLNWINNYVLSPADSTNLRLNLEYFNTASSIWIAKIIKALSTISKPDHVLFIHLYVDIEDSETLGHDDIKDIIGSLTDNLGETKSSICIKIYGTDEEGKIIKESIAFI
jgi:hypothetical protein